MILHMLNTLAAACSSANVNGTSFCTSLPQGTASSSNLRHFVDIFIATLAAISVLIIVIAGLNIVAAGGDSQKVAKARSAIIYALVGLVIAVASYSIVAFVVGKATP